MAQGDREKELGFTPIAAGLERRDRKDSGDDFFCCFLHGLAGVFFPLEVEFSRLWGLLSKPVLCLA